MAKRIIPILSVILCSIAMLMGVLAYRQYHQLQQGLRAAQAGRSASALAAFSSVIRLHVPCSPYSIQASNQLWQLATTAQERGDQTLAIDALHSLRSAWYAVDPTSIWILQSENALNRQQKTTRILTP